MNCAWTPEEEAILRREWAAGTPAPRIGEMVGRSAKGVNMRAALLELGRRQRVPSNKYEWTEEADAALVRMWGEGKLHSEMVVVLGCCAETIRQRANALKLPRRLKPVVMHLGVVARPKPLAPVRLADHPQAFIAASRHERTEEGVRMLAAMIVAGLAHV